MSCLAVHCHLMRVNLQFSSEQIYIDDDDDKLNFRV